MQLATCPTAERSRSPLYQAVNGRESAGGNTWVLGCLGILFYNSLLMTRTITTKQIENILLKLIKQAAFNLPKDVLSALKKSIKKEASKTGKDILQDIIKNVNIAAKENTALCQDTGLALIFLEIGQDVHITGSDLEKSLQRTVAKAYQENYLRSSVVNDPLQRKNTQDNTPAIIHTEIVPGSKLKITFMAKGGGSENCSTLKMLKPSDGLAGIENFVLDTIKNAQANPCPPIIIGLGLGGNFDHSAYLAKKALLRPLDKKHPKASYRKLEKDLLHKINKLGIGPMGLGGKVTALAVHIEAHPCHIASLPVAINIQCHANRSSSVTI